MDTILENIERIVNLYDSSQDYTLIPKELFLTLDESLYLFDFHNLITCYSAVKPDNWVYPWVRRAQSYETREGLIERYNVINRKDT